MDEASARGVVNLITSYHIPSYKNIYFSNISCCLVVIQHLAADNHGRGFTISLHIYCAVYQGTLLRRYPALPAATKVRATVRNILMDMDGLPLGPVGSKEVFGPWEIPEVNGEWWAIMRKAWCFSILLAGTSHGRSPRARNLQRMSKETPLWS